MRGDLNDTGIDREFQWRHSAVPTFWALLIFGLHAIPGKDLPQASWLGEMHMDKLIHLMMFMFLSSSVFIALGKSGSVRKYKWALPRRSDIDDRYAIMVVMSPRPRPVHMGRVGTSRAADLCFWLGICPRNMV